MFDDMFFYLRNWWISNPNEEMGHDEFDKVESKHTRVRHDKDIREIIKVD